MTAGSLTNDSLRELERRTIRAFVEAHADLLRGRVLDYGCGLSPHRDIVERVRGTYVGYDREHYPGNVTGADVGPDPHEWGDLDAVLCNQIDQYLDDPVDVFGGICDFLCGGSPGVLVATGTTTWPVVEPDDRRRHTPAGIRDLLEEAGFRRVDVEERATVRAGDVEFVLGWQAVAYS